MTDNFYLERAIELSESAKKHNNTPFGALLVDEKGKILVEAENSEITSKDSTAHAETNLVRLASFKYDKNFLAKCTLYSSAEPCVMCAGAIYWSGIGRVVYALAETEILKLTIGNFQNPALNLPCRDVFAAGQKKIVVVGPVEELKEKALEPHQNYWS